MAGVPEHVSLSEAEVRGFRFGQKLRKRGQPCPEVPDDGEADDRVLAFVREAAEGWHAEDACLRPVENPPPALRVLAIDDAEFQALRQLMRPVRAEPYGAEVTLLAKVDAL